MGSEADRPVGVPSMNPMPKPFSGAAICARTGLVSSGATTRAAQARSVRVKERVRRLWAGAAGTCFMPVKITGWLLRGERDEVHCGDAERTTRRGDPDDRRVFMVARTRSQACAGGSRQGPDGGGAVSRAGPAGRTLGV